MASKGVALVTGAAQGIGRSIALRLAEDGFDVAVNDISGSSEKLKTLVDEIQNKGRASSSHVADVSQDEEVKAMVERVVSQHGSLDVMVANAGIMGPTVPFFEVSAEQWDHVMAVNGRGPFFCYKYAGIQMIKQGRGGRIIGASSVAGKQGAQLNLMATARKLINRVAMASLGAYSASKFAVRGLTQVAALELGAHNITVNAYGPGPIDTPMGTSFNTVDCSTMLKWNLWGTFIFNNRYINQLQVPEDIASLVSFLASKESQFITGKHISINGGSFFD
ncbi:hypothetical protein K438DRAFT_1908696 [Mycena galopus ATCC 62051]|nr:hypothetical protein K438DRAFT_1908696 [Mycena galopus ATCC 62051]